MVKLSKSYDPSIQKKVFILKGEEAYARTTDILLDVSVSETFHVNYFTIIATMNVLRDSGNSTITVYSGDEVIGVVDCTESSSSITESFNLPYGTHKIHARYNGNKSCLKSESKTIEITQEVTDATSSELYIDSLVHQVDKDTPFDVDLRLESYTASHSYSQYIDVYVDEVLKTTVQTPSDDNTITATIDGLDTGHHTVRAVYSGSEYISGSEASHGLSVGYYVNVTMPSPMLKNNTHTIKAVAYNFFNQKITENLTGILRCNGVDVSSTSFSNGEYHFTTDIIDSSFTVRVGNGYYSSTQLPVFTSISNYNYVNQPTGLVAYQNYVFTCEVTGKNISNTIYSMKTILNDGTVEYAKIGTNNRFSETYNTNDYPYPNGYSIQSMLIGSESGASWNLPVYLYYLNVDDSSLRNKKIRVDYGYFNKVSNGYELKKTKDIDRAVVLFYVAENPEEDWTLVSPENSIISFEVVNASTSNTSTDRFRLFCNNYGFKGYNLRLTNGDVVVIDGTDTVGKVKITITHRTGSSTSEYWDIDPNNQGYADNCYIGLSTNSTNAKYVLNNIKVELV